MSVTLTAGQFLRIPEERQIRLVHQTIDQWASEMCWWEELSDYVRENMHVYRIFVGRALALQRAGVQHWGARNLIEVVRYETTVHDSNPEFKINNNCASEFSRLAMLMFPETFPWGWFEIRDTVARRRRKPNV